MLMKDWIDEPDYLKYRDPDTGLLCVVKRASMGHLCGYVRLPRHVTLTKKAHKLGERVWNETRMPGCNSVRVHGGITFASRLGLRRFAGGKLRGRWVGFDCAHAGDLVPEMVEMIPRLGDGAIYRNVAFVKGELAELCKQIARLHMKAGV